MSIRFQANDKKVVEYILLLAELVQPLTKYSVVKLVFLADRLHLNKYGRPVTGDRYIAMEHGPVPSLVYSMLKNDGFLDPDVAENAGQAFSIAEDNKTLEVARASDRSVFSKSDISVLEEVVREFGGMSFTKLKDYTHGLPEYECAGLNCEIDIDLMIDGGAIDREAIIEDLTATSRSMVI